MNTKAKQNNTEEIEERREANPFIKKSKLIRSPMLDSHIAPRSNTLEDSLQMLSLPSEAETPSALIGSQQVDCNTQTPTTSNGVTAISRMTTPGTAREDTIDRELLKLQDVAVTMAKAVTKQKNCSLDIKNGILRLQEALEVIKECRGKEVKKTKDDKKKKGKATLVGSMIANTPSNKRIREVDLSPQAEKSPSKKKGKDSEGSEWFTIFRKPKRPEKSGKQVEKPITGRPDRKNNRRIRKKPEAVLIKPAEGKTYADILKNIKDKVDPESTETSIKRIRKTQKGDVLLVLAKTKEKEKFIAALRENLNEAAEVRGLENKATLEIRDLDCLTNEDEIQRALDKELNKTVDCKISITKSNSREQKRAFVHIGEKDANVLLKIAKIKVGWVRCNVTRKVEVDRCFRCLTFGHTRVKCTKPEQKDRCYKCGQKGHTVKSCTHPPKCFLCEEIGNERLDHVSGSGSCQVFRDALEKAKKPK